jgi:hypothetical protein
MLNKDYKEMPLVRTPAQNVEESAPLSPVESGNFDAHPPRTDSLNKMWCIFRYWV